jgi:hypothetical protein
MRHDAQRPLRDRIDKCSGHLAEILDTECPMADGAAGRYFNAISDTTIRFHNHQQALVALGYVDPEQRSSKQAHLYAKHLFRA